MEDIPVTANKSSGKFWHGLLISIAAWGLDGLLATLNYSMLIYDRNRPQPHIPIIWTTFYPFIIMLALVWIPVTIFASIKFAKRKIKAAYTAIIITAIISPIIFPWGFAVLVFFVFGY